MYESYAWTTVMASMMVVQAIYRKLYRRPDTRVECLTGEYTFVICEGPTAPNLVLCMHIVMDRV